MTGELAGIPSVAVMTSEFVSAAELMARALGASDYPVVVVQHPISSATPQQLSERAREAAVACIERLVDRELQAPR